MKRSANQTRTVPFNLWLAKACQSDLLLALETDKFLEAQYSGADFQRLDVIVRLLAIEDYLGFNTGGRYLYEKMQQERGHCPQFQYRFQPLIEKVAEGGYNLQSRIRVDRDLRLLDGSHRLSVALFSKQPAVSIVVEGRQKIVRYGEDWFVAHGFSTGELNAIRTRKERLFRDQGLYFSAIIWPSAHPFAQEIEKAIGSQYRIIWSDEYTFGPNPSTGSGHDLNTFVEAVYRSDDIAEWKVQQKLQAMAGWPATVRHIGIEIPQPSFRKKRSTGFDISSAVERLKEDVRRRFAPCVPGYIYDIVIHIGDNYRHNRHIQSLFSQYMEFQTDD